MCGRCCEAAGRIPRRCHGSAIPLQQAKRVGLFQGKLLRSLLGGGDLCSFSDKRTKSQMSSDLRIDWRSKGERSELHDVLNVQSFNLEEQQQPLFARCEAGHHRLFPPGVFPRFLQTFLFWYDFRSGVHIGRQIRYGNLDQISRVTIFAVTIFAASPRFGHWRRRAPSSLCCAGCCLTLCACTETLNLLLIGCSLKVTSITEKASMSVRFTTHARNGCGRRSGSRHSSRL